MSNDADVAVSPAATVVVMRAGAADGAFEVLLLRRSSQLVFYGGAWVFPGGRIDACDGDLSQFEQAARRAAVRELHEESGLVVDAAELVPFAQWITPPGNPRRFDTWYFACRAPDGAVRIDRGEVDAHRWMTPAAALRARAAGEIELPPPTFVTLAQLATYADLDAAHAALRAAPVQRYIPRPCRAAEGMVYLYEGDAGYASGDATCPGPRHRLIAGGDGFRYERSG